MEQQMNSFFSQLPQQLQKKIMQLPEERRGEVVAQLMHKMHEQKEPTQDSEGVQEEQQEMAAYGTTMGNKQPVEAERNENVTVPGAEKPSANGGYLKKLSSNPISGETTYEIPDDDGSNTHEQGGVDLELEPHSAVNSDKMKIKQDFMVYGRNFKGKTFKDASDYLSKKEDGIQKTFNTNRKEGEVDDTSETSLALMLAKISINRKDLNQLQEAQLEMKHANEKHAYIDKNKKKFGGLIKMNEDNFQTYVSSNKPADIKKASDGIGIGIDKFNEFSSSIKKGTSVQDFAKAFQASGLAKDLQKDYAGNKSIDFKPIAKMSGSLKERGVQATNFFIQKGYKPEHAAAIVGNLMQESNLDPTVTNSIGAFGIAQWYKGRKVDFNKWADSQGKSKYDFNTQLEYVHHELQTSHKGANKALLSAQSMEDAVLAIRKKYEIPGEAEANDAKRMGYATYLMKSIPQQPAQQPQEEYMEYGGSIKADVGTLTKDILGREKSLGYNNWGFTTLDEDQDGNVDDITYEKASEKFMNDYYKPYLEGLPVPLQFVAGDFAMNSEDPRGALLEAAGIVDHKGKVSKYYEKGKFSSSKVKEDWEKNKDAVLAKYKADPNAFLDAFDAARVTSYKNTNGAGSKLDEWLGRVKSSREQANKYLTTKNAPAKSIPTSSNEFYKGSPTDWATLKSQAEKQFGKEFNNPGEYQDYMLKEYPNLVQRMFQIPTDEGGWENTNQGIQKGVVKPIDTYEEAVAAFRDNKYRYRGMVPQDRIFNSDEEMQAAIKGLTPETSVGGSQYYYDKNNRNWFMPDVVSPSNNPMTPIQPKGLAKVTPTEGENAPVTDLGLEQQATGEQQAQPEQPSASPLDRVTAGLRNASPYLAAMSRMFEGRISPVLQQKPYQNPYENLRTDYDIQSSLNDIDRQSLTGSADARGNPSVRNARMAQIYANAEAAKNQMYSQKYNQERQAENQKEIGKMQYLNQFTDTNMAYKKRFEQEWLQTIENQRQQRYMAMDYMANLPLRKEEEDAKIALGLSNSIYNYDPITHKLVIDPQKAYAHAKEQKYIYADQSAQIDALKKQLKKAQGKYKDDPTSDDFTPAKETSKYGKYVK